MTIYEQGFQEGFRQGVLEVIQHELSVLNEGELPANYVARLQTVSIEELHRYGERILTASSLEAVFADPT